VIADGGSTSRSQRHVHRETFILFEMDQERAMCTSASLNQKYRLAFSVFVMAAHSSLNLTVKTTLKFVDF